MKSACFRTSLIYFILLCYSFTFLQLFEGKRNSPKKISNFAKGLLRTSLRLEDESRSTKRLTE